MSQIADRLVEMDRTTKLCESTCSTSSSTSDSPSRHRQRIVDAWPQIPSPEGNKIDGGDIRDSKPEAVAERGACPAEDPCHPSPPSPYSWAWEAWT